MTNGRLILITVCVFICAGLVGVGLGLMRSGKLSDQSVIPPTAESVETVDNGKQDSEETLDNGAHEEDGELEAEVDLLDPEALRQRIDEAYHESGKQLAEAYKRAMRKYCTNVQHAMYGEQLREIEQELDGRIVRTTDAHDPYKKYMKRLRAHLLKRNLDEAARRGVDPGKGGEDAKAFLEIAEQTPYVLMGEGHSYRISIATLNAGLTGDPSEESLETILLALEFKQELIEDVIQELDAM